MALKVEVVVDGGVHAEEALGGSSRLEALLLALLSSHGLMRILRPIVFPEPLLMLRKSPKEIRTVVGAFGSPVPIHRPTGAQSGACGLQPRT